MRGLLTGLLLVIMLGGVAMAGDLATISPDKKLIEWGWDEPGPAFMRANAADMDRLGFDGLIFHADAVRDGKAMNFTWECWSAKEFRYADLQQSVENLRACKFKRLTELFLRFNVCPGNVDWFDDAGMATVMNNARLAARVAREGGCRGFMFDVEMYGEPLFSYQALIKKNDRPFAEYEAKVRQRGREFMQAVNCEYPDITMLMTYAYSITGFKGDRSKAQYGLLKNFLDGMLEAAAPKTVIVDGWEGAYSYRKHSQFVAARKMVREQMLEVTAVPGKYRQHMRVAFGIWMDMDFRRYGWHTNAEDFDANYFMPEEFEYSVFSGLHATDKYVWIYTEKPLWWTHTRVPLAYRKAIKQSRDPRAIDDSQVGLRRIKGDTGAKGPVAANQPSYSDEATFGDLKDKYSFIADLPKQWLFKLDKDKVGVKEQWYAPGLNTATWQPLEIGRFWDDQGVQYSGLAWYRVDWTAPQFDAAGKDVWLWFGAVDEAALVYVNGVKAGEHDIGGDMGWDKRFPIKVTGLIKPGEKNTIAVRVTNEALAGGIWKSIKLAVSK
ncbi:MAG: hypothetical protein ABFD94_00360 [Armatimonadia bacterium]